MRGIGAVLEPDACAVGRATKDGETNMVALVGCDLGDAAFGIGRGLEAEPVLDATHPQVRFAIVSGPVVDVRNMDESGRGGIAGVKDALLAFEARDIAGEAVDPFTGLGRREPDD